MGQNGGARPGAGRKAKAEKFAGPIAAAEERIADRLPELIDNMMRLASGVMVYRPRKGKEKIDDPDQLDESDTADFYMTPPDFKANEYLLNRILGKPTEAIEISGPDGGGVPLTVAFESAVAKIYGDPKPPAEESPE
ncbi:hypothetical protein [Singulisphaera sp. PoT]|uniref:hypothetical protein n=1 Tax=Singulisphaera sp. PoT TaxID=3411797 RepID=UPI003BF55CF1